MVLYGQVVVGPPGSGKTTYCNGMQQYLRLIGRECFVVNLDPANEYYGPRRDDDNDEHDEDEPRKWSWSSSSSVLPYDTIVNVCEDVVSLSSVTERTGLGPNGGLLYCMEYLYEHVDELARLLSDRVDEVRSRDDGRQHPYLLFDFPGQAELTTHCDSVQRLLDALVRALDLRLCAVQLVDSHFCREADKFVAATLLSTATMIRLELPAVNVLSKIDLLSNDERALGELPFPLDFFTDLPDLSRLADRLDDHHHDDHVGAPRSDDDDDDERVDYADDEEYAALRKRLDASPFRRRRRRLHADVCAVVDDFGLLRYRLLDVRDAASVGRILAEVDRCNGRAFVEEAAAAYDHDDDDDGRRVRDLFRCAAVVEGDGAVGLDALSVRERFGGGEAAYQETIPELRRLEEEAGVVAAATTTEEET